MRYSAAVVAAGLLAAACGPQPPDYAVLDNYEVDACGQTLSAATVVQKIYEGDRLEGLTTPETLPPGAFQAYVTEGDERLFPCAEDAEAARARLATAGFTDLQVASEGERLLAFEGRDPWGIDGVYTVFRCEFAGEISHVRKGSAVEQGLTGRLAGASAESPITDDDARGLAALAFATGMTQVMEDGYHELVDSRLSFIAQDTGFAAGPFDEPEAETLEICGAWLEPRYTGGCDAIRIGAASLILDRETGDFHQVAVRPLPLTDPLDPDQSLYGFQGYCGP